MFFVLHAVPGVETYEITADRLAYRRTLRLAHGPALLELIWADETLKANLELSDPADRDVALDEIRHLCDLDLNPTEMESHLRRDPHLGALVAASPGLRVPGTTDPQELLFRTMIGQQISLAGAANCAGKLVARFGDRLPGQQSPNRPDRLFPTAEALATADPQSLPMPRARGRALVAMATALADGTVGLSSEADPVETRIRLLACPGIGPWTADYVTMRAFHQPDILLASDLVIKRELVSRGIRHTLGWSPWRSYATMHLWRAWTG